MQLTLEQLEELNTSVPEPVPTTLEEPVVSTSAVKTLNASQLEELNSFEPSTSDDVLNQVFNGEPVQQEEVEASTAVDFGRVFLDAAETVAYTPFRLANIVSETFGKGEVMPEALMRKNTKDVVRMISTPLSLFDGTQEKLLDSVFDEQNKIRPTETVGGAVAEMAPYVAFGAGTYGLKALQKLPVVFKGMAAGAITDQLLTKPEDEENLFNVVQTYLPDTVVADYTSFMAVEEADTDLVKRVKLIGEGATVGLFVDLLGGVGKAAVRAKKKYGKRPAELTDEERGEVLLDYFEEAKEIAGLKNREDNIVYNETPEGAAQVTMQQSSGLNRVMRQVFSSRGYWTPKAFNAFEDAQYAQRQAVAQSEHIANRLQKSLNGIAETVEGPEIFKSVNDALTANLKFTRGLELKDKISDVANQFNLPRDIAEEVLNARELIDDMSRKLLGSSAVPDSLKETIAENSGSYLRLSYRLYEDSGYTPSESVLGDAREFLVTQNLKKDPNLSEERAYVLADNTISDILSDTDKKDIVDYMGRVRKVNTEILKGLKKIPEPIKALMGEITEPAENIILTVSKMTRLYENNKFFATLDNLGTQGKYIFDAETPRNSKVFNTKITGTNSNLDGKYTTPEIFKAIQGKEVDFRPTGKILQAYVKVQGKLQKWKTVYSHVTELKNITGGAQFGPANGVLPFSKESIKTLQTLANSVRQGGDKALDAAYEKFLRLGIINTNVKLNEVREVLNSGYMGESDRSRGEKWLTDRMGAAGETADKVLKGAEDVYVATDDYYKIVYFLQELETLKLARPDVAEDILEAEAARVIKTTMTNYDFVPKAIKAIKDFPLGSFVAFPSEIIRTSTNILRQASREITSGNEVLKKRGKKRLAGFMATQGAMQAAAITSAVVAGFSKEEAEAIHVLSETPWSKTAPRILRKGDDGKIYAVDTQFIDSFSAIKEPLRAFYNGINEGNLKGEELDKVLVNATADTLLALLKPYYSETVLTKGVADIVFATMATDGRTPEGKELFSPGLSIAEKGENLAYHILNFAAPGTITSLAQLAKAAFEVPNKTTGKPKSFEAELATNLTGVRFKEVVPKDSLMFAVKGYKFKVSQIIAAKPNYVLKGEELRERNRQRQKALYKEEQELYRQIMATETVIKGPATMQILLDNGISKKKASLLMSGFFEAEKPSKNMMYQILQKTPTDLPKETQETFEGLQQDYMDMRLVPLIVPKEPTARETESMSRMQKAKGGTVDVPNAPAEPDERIDKLTGRPYNQQAGAAYMDEEDPMRRLGFGKGGRIQKAIGGDIAAKLVGISKEDLNWAKAQDKRYDSKEALDGKGDAARHLALGWITQRAEHPEAALAAANFRENLSITRKDKPMDQFNNNLGAQIQAKNFKEAEKEIDRLIKEKKAQYMTPKESQELRPYGYSKGGKVSKALRSNCNK